MMGKILTVFDTHPEAIKVAPLMQALQAEAGFASTMCVNARHRQMLDQVLELFGIVPEFDLNLMRPGQTLSNITSNVLSGIDGVLDIYKPDTVPVHSDTTTTLTASLAALYRHIPIGYVEASLRTGNIWSPWPEELSRCVTDSVATWHFVPAAESRQNLPGGGIDPEQVTLIGNIVIDASLAVRQRLDGDAALPTQLAARYPFLTARHRMILVTGHRHENFGEPLENFYVTLHLPAAWHPDVQVVYPVHLNPNVQQPVSAILSGRGDVHLITPRDYLPLAYLMDRAYLIVTDSGGIQEETPALSGPVLAIRDTTEQPEAVTSDIARLIDTDTQHIVNEAETLLNSAPEYERMVQAHNLYGDDQACRHIVDAPEQAFTAQSQKVARDPQLIRRPATKAEVFDLEAARTTAQGSSTRHHLNG